MTDDTPKQKVEPTNDPRPSAMSGQEWIDPPLAPEVFVDGAVQADVSTGAVKVAFGSFRHNGQARSQVINLRIVMSQESFLSVAAAFAEWADKLKLAQAPPASDQVN